MKKIVALFLTAALLLGVLGTSAFAAETGTLTIPEFTASVSADGTVTVTVGSGKLYEYAYAYVTYPDNPNSSTSVWLTWDEGKKAYVGKNAELAGGKLDTLDLYTNTYIYIDDYKEETFDRNEFYASYANGKLSNASVSVSKGKGRQIEYTYTDSDGKQHTNTTLVTVESKGESIFADYDTNTGKKTGETHYFSEEKGDGKTSVAEKRISESKSYEKETGKLISTSVGEEERTDE